MVRVKFRYLVVNFLYPEPSSKSRTALPDLVQIHSPTPDSFNAGALVRLVRDAVEDLYGDYGSGMVSSSLKGMSHTLGFCIPASTNSARSQLLFPLHSKRFTSSKVSDRGCHDAGSRNSGGEDGCERDHFGCLVVESCFRKEGCCRMGVC